MIDWIKDNLAQYSLTTIALGGLAALFFFKKVIKLAIFFGVLAAVFALGFFVAAAREDPGALPFLS